ncbi:hypothetical protein LAUMK42_01550 [Mycobacterium persicum]|uniref:Uncharacterized protein n=1 Tax=Mycobacterium persicum TaxID=1487726 RepID=A0AB38UQ12_9MYCO|nr:hypothetical protein LAUMK42_01550 [Mycobacterium persicum]
MTVFEGLAPLAQGLAPAALTFAQLAGGLAPLAPLGTHGAKTRYPRVLYEVDRFTSQANCPTRVERLRGSATECQGCQGCQATSDLHLLGANPDAKGCQPLSEAVRR